MMTARLALVVEDDEHIAAIVAFNLRDLGFEVRVARDGIEAIELLHDRPVDVVVLDIMLPRLDGFAVCQAIRTGSRYVPVLMLTARGEELDRLLGLELGADDYLTKPFSVRELLARVKALMRRADASGRPARRARRADPPCRRRRDRPRTAPGHRCRTAVDPHRKGVAVTLFVQHPGRAYSRRDLMHLVWGYAHDADAHTVNSHINRLRAKLEVDPARPQYILTVRGIGYKLAESRAD